MYNTDTDKEVCCLCGNDIESYEDFEVIGWNTFCEECSTASDEAQDRSDNSSCYSVTI